MVREFETPKPSARFEASESKVRIASDRDIAPGKRARTLRDDLDWIAMKAVRKDPSQRYSTASAFAEDLRRYLADEIVNARPSSAAYRLRKFARRNPNALQSAFILIGVLAIAVAAMVYAQS